MDKLHVSKQKAIYSRNMLPVLRQITSLKSPSDSGDRNVIVYIVYMITIFYGFITVNGNYHILFIFKYTFSQLINSLTRAV